MISIRPQNDLHFLEYVWIYQDLLIWPGILQLLCKWVHAVSHLHLFKIISSKSGKCQLRKVSQQWSNTIKWRNLIITEKTSFFNANCLERGINFSTTQALWNPKYGQIFSLQLNRWFILLDTHTMEFSELGLINWHNATWKQNENIRTDDFHTHRPKGLNSIQPRCSSGDMRSAAEIYNPLWCLCHHI